MGRNVIPKMCEWRNGELYSFRASDNTAFDGTDSGKLIIYERLRVGDNPEKPISETLAVFWADGLHECVAAAFESGLSKGKKIGRSEAQAEIKRALGLK